MGAVVASLVAPLVRAELGVIAVTFALRGVLLLPHERGRKALARILDGLGLDRRRRADDGRIVFFSAVVGNFSQSWLIATGHYRGG